MNVNRNENQNANRNRNRILAATVLRVRSFTENAREGFFLTREEGVVRATVYGGGKSKLRAYVSPFNSGVLYLYHDPVRDSNKVTDFDCQNWRPGLREKYERTMAADEIAKTILAGLGGSFDDALQTADETLDALEDAADIQITPLLVHFWWRWAAILGIRPSLDRLGDSLGYRLPALGDGAATWLATTGSLPPAQIGRFPLDQPALEEAATFCHALLR
ncbi:MAG: recombination protein O N-terminal domain-containing protein [Spirochaetaceae bacterium]|jgi:DNA repair protein RecO (recombination protein O)|nr:recombination protein O N-terminal domain-containing protein [Spirochaetaceae bacterium]